MGKLLLTETLNNLVYMSNLEIWSLEFKWSVATKDYSLIGTVFDSTSSSLPFAILASLKESLRSS